ncbi:rhodanese-like domain-containing protein [Sansalvadorimonas sp. 2012CJ34-2]|uniref:Rhodanese-like domain-containing protein n=1 Tax=Parendozoicomonas callyspongiae TaxID=2942213 RepID=A0ABT0PKQ0_9GAMM|nr:rhodanese-like domain-containing protein [Sansalvadorimonas sp. 2012CJ34-2]MCL6271967.1 rhodanese-like domain-containing protein [Sansalvadorimonas sp. 2012CJ34-2]
MSDTLPPVDLIEPAQLVEQLEAPDLMILDVSNPATYQQLHIPGAIHIAPSELISGKPPATGKLPSLEQLNQLFSRVGYLSDKSIVVYDDEGGGWAGRLIWTLDLLGHKKLAYLNGGLHAWMSEQLPVENTPVFPAPTETNLKIINPQVRASAEEIMVELNSSTVIWDARSPGEYDGSKQFAMRTGHIPGAINFEWTQGMDTERFYRLRNDLANLLNGIGLGKEKNIITHCQTHHRSGFTYLAARILGYKNIRAYDGSWSEWGNRSDTPITTAD